MSQTFSEPPRSFAARPADASPYAKQLRAMEQHRLNAGRETASWCIMTFFTTGLAVAATSYASKLVTAV